MAKLNDDNRTGQKSNETRSWATSYRGDIAIHAGKVLDRHMACDDRVLAAMGWQSSHQITYPAGAVLCVVEIYDVVPSERIVADLLAEQVNNGNDEIHFGDYSPVRFVWLTRNLRPLREPVRTRGYQKIWTLDPEVEAQVRAQL